jgi:hypothetical protein|tara:strand:- start:421 stop:783 length:363 start_codon:yes stop_codon:yes gene_type:complete
MGYTLSDDEVALVLRPINYDEDGVWSGMISTGLAMGPEGNIDKVILSDLIKCATFLSAFLDIAHEYPNIMEVVEKRRDEVIEMFERDADEEINGLAEVEIQTSGGQVIKFGPTSKTKGNA